MTSLTATRETMPAFVQELERIARTKADYVVAEGDVQAFDNVEQPGLSIPGSFNSRLAFQPTDHALNQVHDRLGIPREYGRKLASQKPALWADNVNGWARDSKKNVLVRTLDGRARSVVSDKYRVLDNLDLFYSAYQTLKDADAVITTASLTDHGNRFYLRAIVPGWETVVAAPDVTPKFGGDTVYPGILLQNSETGQGGLTVSPFIFRKVCMNGLVLDDSLRKIHLGERQQLGYLSDETREKDSELVWLQVRDLIKATFDRDNFQRLVANFADTQEVRLPSPIRAVNNVVKAFGLSDADRQAILDELVAPSYEIDPGRTIYGLINAVTNRAKHYADDPDRVAEFERIGGSIMAEPEMVLVVRK